MNTLKSEIAATAAALVVEEGLEYGPAKRRALKQLALPARTALPDNGEMEDAVREYIELFCADTQPVELAALRELALVWMERLATFRPYLAGAVWHGTATRLSPLYDLNSYLPYQDGRSVTLAMKIGLTERDPERIDREAWDELARDCRLAPAAVLERGRAMADTLLQSGPDVIEQSSSGSDSPVPAQLADGITRHVHACLHRL